MEVSNFYNDYKNKNYSKIIAAKESDYQVMGIGNRQQFINQYIQLYKGLSFLNESQPANAINQFNLVLKNADIKSNIYYQAKWYAALSYFKINNINNTVLLLKEITKTASPYKKKAANFLNDLKR